MKKLGILENVLETVPWRIIIVGTADIEIVLDAVMLKKIAAKL